MKTWIVEPRDTLIIRDGRPVREGSPPMQSVDFPWPSTIAGFVRTRVGMNDHGVFTLDATEAKKIRVTGPWLAELDDDGRIVKHYVPAPQDCSWRAVEDDSQKLRRVRLSLQPIPEGCQTDLANGFDVVGCAPEEQMKKPARGPAFWRFDDVMKWLLDPQDDETLSKEFGHAAPIHEQRFHAAIDESTGAARDEHLFSTDGLRFTTRARKRFALAFHCDDSRLREGLATVGGERRMSFLREAAGMSVPAFPADFKLGSDRIARVVLLTPAMFKNGFAPTSFGEGTRVIGACVGRAEVISGWDFVTRGPKQTRRMAPAGSVYWVKIDPSVDAKTWAEGVWMKCVSDDQQDKLDGFGLAVVGVG